MKIHIVQKGDTLWELAKQYGVDFAQLKEVNPQLSSPDMIMPGMKIKIPSTSKPVKSNYASEKEMKKPMTKHPYKDTSPKPMPTINEDDHKKPVNIQPKMPIQPEMPAQPMTPVQPQMQQPAMEQEMNYYDTTINLPHHYQPQKEEPKEMQQMPQQVVMICPHCFKPSCPPPMHHGNPYPMGKEDCGCGGPEPMHHGNPYPMGKEDCGCGGNEPMHMYDPPTNNNMMGSNMMGSYQQSPNMQMPKNPEQTPYNNNYNPYNASPQGMGMQPGFHSQNLPPQSHPHFLNDADQNMPYPAPPQFPGNQMFNYREDEDDSKGE